MPKQPTTFLLSLLLTLLSTLTTTTTAFPIHFPLSALTNATLLLPNQIPSVAADPATLSSWSEEPPSILLCQFPHFAGECFLLEDNTAQTCLNLDPNAGGTGTRYAAPTGSVGMEVGSLRVGGGGACVVFG